MKTKFLKFLNHYERFIFIALLTLMLLLAVYSHYEYMKIFKSFTSLQNESQSLKGELQDLNQKYANTILLVESKEKDKQSIVESLNQIGLDYNNLMQKYNTTMGEVLSLKRTVEIDDELLKKYSKFYFLNENYSPTELVSLSPSFTNNKDIKLIPMAKFRLEQMIMIASTTGINIVVNSGYRSFTEQKGLKGAYSQTYGITKANSFSADQGYSEHQLGTTVDLSDGKNVMEASFDKTKTFLWLKDNAHLYGFIMSYPKNNKYYVYEPWHYRFVGIELATYLYNNKLNFYDLEQKFIDQFKLKMFE